LSQTLLTVEVAAALATVGAELLTMKEPRISNGKRLTGLQRHCPQRR